MPQCNSQCSPQRSVALESQTITIDHNNHNSSQLNHNSTIDPCDNNNKRMDAAITLSADQEVMLESLCAFKKTVCVWAKECIEYLNGLAEENSPPKKPVDEVGVIIMKEEYEVQQDVCAVYRMQSKLSDLIWVHSGEVGKKQFAFQLRANPNDWCAKMLKDLSGVVYVVYCHADRYMSTIKPVAGKVVRPILLPNFPAGALEEFMNRYAAFRLDKVYMDFASRKVVPSSLRFAWDAPMKHMTDDHHWPSLRYKMSFSHSPTETSVHTVPPMQMAAHIFKDYLHRVPGLTAGHPLCVPTITFGYNNGQAMIIPKYDDDDGHEDIASHDNADTIVASAHLMCMLIDQGVTETRPIDESRPLTLEQYLDMTGKMAKKGMDKVHLGLVSCELARAFQESQTGQRTKRQRSAVDDEDDEE